MVGTEEPASVTRPHVYLEEVRHAALENVRPPVHNGIEASNRLEDDA
jgi:hypothetical protein